MAVIFRRLSFFCFLVLGGCGTMTYGTGVTQEAQLLDDMTSIATLGTLSGGNEIDYLSRPDLVNPPSRSDLPEPVSADVLDDGTAYFPVNPEERRADILRRIRAAEESGEELPEEIIALRREAIESGDIPKGYSGGGRGEEEADDWDPNKVREQREAFLEYQKRFAAVEGAAPRRWLTEPPRKYRTPEATAPVGLVGEKEIDPEELKAERSSSSSGGLFDWLTGDDDDEEENADSESDEDSSDDDSSDDDSTETASASDDDNGFVW